jgi:hypothetical protein
MPIKPGAITIEIIHQTATTTTMIILFIIMGMAKAASIMKEGEAAMGVSIRREIGAEAAAMKVGMGAVEEVMAEAVAIDS